MTNKNIALTDEEIQEIYTGAYDDKMASLVDLWDGSKDAESGTPWQTYHLDELDKNLNEEGIRAQAALDAKEDAGEVEELLLEEVE